MDAFLPVAATWSRLDPLLSFKDGSAPFCISISKAFCLSVVAAIISGVIPKKFLESTSKPSDNSLMIMDVFPPCAAKWSRLDPSLVFKDGSAQFCISISKAPSWPLRAVYISAVVPFSSLESTSHPWDSSNSIISMFPLFAAAWISWPSLSLHSALEAQSSISAGTVLPINVATTLCPRMAILKINLNATEKYIG